MILVHQEIKHLIEIGILEADPKDVGPSSVDVHLSDKIMVEMWNERKIVSPARGDGPKLTEVTIGEKGYIFTPGEFFLGSVIEKVNLPDWITAEFRLNSTAARCGLEHALAVWVDPGFSGRITLELKNGLKYSDMILFPGDRIGQMIFHAHQPTDIPYRGSYKNDTTTQTAKAH